MPARPVGSGVRSGLPPYRHLPRTVGTGRLVAIFAGRSDGAGCVLESQMPRPAGEGGPSGARRPSNPQGGLVPLPRGLLGQPLTPASASSGARGGRRSILEGIVVSQADRSWAVSGRPPPPPAPGRVRQSDGIDLWWPMVGARGGWDRRCALGLSCFASSFPQRNSVSLPAHERLSYSMVTAGNRGLF